MPSRSAFLVFILAIALAAGEVAAAQQKHATPKHAAQNHPVQKRMSLEQAVEQVQAQTHGRILAADTIPRGQNKLYRIKVLTPDGHVRVLQLRSDKPDGKSDDKRKGN